MGKSKGMAVSIAIIAIISVLAAGFAFAAYEATLEIGGQATVKAANWDIKFTNLSTVSRTGNAQEITAPNLNDTSIGTYNVSFTSPGDSVSYTFKVVNSGTFDAKLTTATIPTPTCSQNGDSTTTDAVNVCKNLTYTLTYNDTNKTPVAVNNTISKKDDNSTDDEKEMVLTLTYNANTPEGELPENDVTISNLGITLIYTQQ